MWCAQTILLPDEPWSIQPILARPFTIKIVPATKRIPTSLANSSFLYLKFLQPNLWTALLKMVLFHHGDSCKHLFTLLFIYRIYHSCWDTHLFLCDPTRFPGQECGKMQFSRNVTQSIPCSWYDWGFFWGLLALLERGNAVAWDWSVVIRCLAMLLPRANQPPSIL